MDLIKPLSKSDLIIITIKNQLFKCVILWRKKERNGIVVGVLFLLW